MSELAIRTDKLVKVYSKLRAVDELSINVPRGCIYGFLGRNGAGKSTTIRILLGLARPTAGDATVLGFSIRRDPVAILQRTAYVSEGKVLYGNLTGRELVRFTRGFYPHWSDEAVNKYARAFEVPMDRPFAKLSLGNRTKVCLLLALAQNADLLILDEPTSGLDPVGVDEFQRVVVADLASEGRTVLISSHQLSDIERIADHVGVIDYGRLLLEPRLDDIKDQFRLITATGAALPQGKPDEIVSMNRDGDFCRYMVRSNAEAFAAELRSQGANVTDVSPLGLREIFLELVRKEQSCTSGNAGEITASVSSAHS
jgi:ABC-2 type transport system ATP-binding protein